MSGRRRRWRADQNDFHSVCLCRFWNHSSGLRAVWSNNKSMTIWFKKEIIFNFMSHERAVSERFRFAIPLSISTWDFSLGSAVAVCMANGQNSNQLKRKSTERRSEMQPFVIDSVCLARSHSFIYSVNEQNSLISSFLQLNAGNKYLSFSIMHFA